MQSGYNFVGRAAFRPVGEAKAARAGDTIRGFWSSAGFWKVLGNLFSGSLVKETFVYTRMYEGACMAGKIESLACPRRGVGRFARKKNRRQASNLAPGRKVADGVGGAVRSAGAEGSLTETGRAERAPRKQKPRKRHKTGAERWRGRGRGGASEGSGDSASSGRTKARNLPRGEGSGALRARSARSATEARQSAESRGDKAEACRGRGGGRDRAGAKRRQRATERA